MKRLVLALIAALGLLGCKSAPQASDPFMRTTVPPPGTGAGDPYYPPGAPPGAAPPMPNGMPANTPPPAKYTPPGGNIYFQQSSTDKPMGDKSATDKPAPGSLAAALASGPNTFEASAASAKGDSETPDGTPPDNEDADLPSMKNSDRFKVGASEFAADNPVKPAAISAKKSSEPLAAKSAPVAKSAPAAKPKPTVVAAEEPVAAESAPQELPAEPEVFRRDRSRMNTSEIRLASATVPVPSEEEFAPEPEDAASNSVAVNDDAAFAEDSGSEIRILSPENSGHSSEGNSLAISETPPLPSDASPTRQETALVVRSPRNFTAAPPTEITELPSKGFRPARKPINVVQASHSMAVASDSDNSHKSTPIRPTIVGAPAAISRNGVRYGHGPSYEWLHGRLEYSQGSKQWKIRYIPIDGQTDDYGGSVLLKESPALEGFKAGDFVAIQGSLGQKNAARGYSPTYDLRMIEPLRQ